MKRSSVSLSLSASCLTYAALKEPHPNIREVLVVMDTPHCPPFAILEVITVAAASADRSSAEEPCITSRAPSTNEKCLKQRRRS